MRHLSAVVATAVAALVLFGCSLESVSPPAPNGPAFDDRLLGTWYGIDERGKPRANAFLHFIKLKDGGGPMHMLLTETGDYGVFELHTAQLPGKRAFAMRKLHPPADPEGTRSAEYTKFTLGVYDIRGNALVIRLYAPEKLRAAIDAKSVKGTIETGNFASATLTGSPEEVTRFLSSPEADAALGEPRTLARRLPPPR
jgi:hypothetical protein